MPPSNLRNPHVHHALYELNARVWLNTLSQREGRRFTLATVPSSELDALQRMGVDAVWLMGVWRTGERGRAEALRLEALRAGYDQGLPGWTSKDVGSSPYAVTAYEVDAALGGRAGLAALRQELHLRGMGLVLDFVPNHTALDHPWVTQRPELYVHGQDGALACGKDPYFPPWTDTAQLDHRTQETQDVLTAALRDVADQCDGVRCDMAMLVLPEVFSKTWKHASPPEGPVATRNFWARAVDDVRERHPGFVFIAEAYWGLEWRLQSLGFDFTYDKTLYDRLVEGHASDVREHLKAAADYQARSVRFTENHDEPRIRARVEDGHARAATAVAWTVPGLRFIHEGQREGYVRRLPVQLQRREDEPPHAETVAFHQQLLPVLQHPALRFGTFNLLAPRDVGDGTAAHVLAHRWDHPRGGMVVVVNLSPRRARARIPLDLHGIAGRQLTLHCWVNGERYLRDGDELLDANRGLWVDLPPWGVHLLDVLR